MRKPKSMICQALKKTKFLGFVLAEDYTELQWKLDQALEQGYRTDGKWWRTKDPHETIMVYQRRRDKKIQSRGVNYEA